MDIRNDIERPIGDPVESALPGWTSCESPIGPLTVVAGSAGITNIHFAGEGPRMPAGRRRAMPRVLAQLDAYFAGEREAFELVLDLRGDQLQKLVWKQLLEIPYGETRSYGELAREIDEGAFPEGVEPYQRPRVVGAAIGRNPVPVVVACHRVIGADGALRGYRGGLERKRKLLELEGWYASKRVPRATPAKRQLPLL